MEQCKEYWVIFQGYPNAKDDNAVFTDSVYYEQYTGFLSLFVHNKKCIASGYHEACDYAWQRLAKCMEEYPDCDCSFSIVAKEGVLTAHHGVTDNNF